jgi:transcriptional regulator with XRE-family HTH domain
LTTPVVRVAGMRSTSLYQADCCRTRPHLDVRVIDNSRWRADNHHVPEVEPEYRQIGSIVRRRRRDRELSQAALASECHMSRSALANVEAGQQRIAVHQLLMLARALRVDVAELVPPQAAGEQPLDAELVEKGVPEPTARAVAKVVSDFMGGEGGSSSDEG